MNMNIVPVGVGLWLSAKCMTVWVWAVGRCCVLQAAGYRCLDLKEIHVCAHVLDTGRSFSTWLVSYIVIHDVSYM